MDWVAVMLRMLVARAAATMGSRGDVGTKFTTGPTYAKRVRGVAGTAGSLVKTLYQAMMLKPLSFQLNVLSHDEFLSVRGNYPM
jgi:hypothetical protein